MIYFIGAGPGDPELITVKGKRLIDEADIIIYAGSLVNPQVLSGARPEAEIYNSATMNLEEVLDVMKRGVAAGKKSCPGPYRRSVYLRCPPGTDGGTGKNGNSL